MNGLDTFQNVVVLMLENRSFDNLLGYLYMDGVPQGKQFDGLQNGPYSQPVPPQAADYATVKSVDTHPATFYDEPYPDPGEEYQHINTQLYNYVGPGNWGVVAAQMQAPYNIPNPQPQVPDMQGFVTDYVSNLVATGIHNPTVDQYGQIMGAFTPAKTPVLTTLAGEFAVFDHWHCSVPSQTWCNRSFWHAATSGGNVINPIGEGGGLFESLKSMNHWRETVWSQPTLFTRLKEAGLSYHIYGDLIPATALINGIDLMLHSSIDFNRFYQDASAGNLPTYAFLEPKFFGQHNDQHPCSENKPTRDGTVLLGEKLIWDVYMAIKNSPQRDQTLLIITHDEHGGCFDHVHPGPAVPPNGDGPGEKGFGFDRLGIRVPMVMVSPYIAPNTIVNEAHDHTSFIKMMCDKWGLPGLTARDQNASSFAYIFTDQHRASYPDIPEPVVQPADPNERDDDRLNGLQQSFLIASHCIALQNATLDAPVPNAEGGHLLSTVGEAMDHLKKLVDLF